MHGVSSSRARSLFAARKQPGFGRTAVCAGCATMLVARAELVGLLVHAETPNVKRDEKGWEPFLHDLHSGCVVHVLGFE